MSKTNFNELLEAGCHFGHLRRKWNPAMAQYIFMEKNGIHIIDLHKTIEKLEEACEAAKQIAKSGRKILFVATKKQAKELVAEQVKAIGMPYVTERWPGGMLTNFATIRKAVRKMSQLDELMNGPEYKNLSKRERLQIQRERAKLEKNLGSISDLSRLPSAIFVVDILKEHIAIAEARRLNIPTFAIVDTNSNPNLIDFPIPANDDASKSIAIIVKVLCEAIAEGASERSFEKGKEGEDDADDMELDNESDMDDDVATEDDKSEKVTAVKKVKSIEGEDPENKKGTVKKAAPKKAPAKKTTKK